MPTDKPDDYTVTLSQLAFVSLRHSLDKGEVSFIPLHHCTSCGADSTKLELLGTKIGIPEHTKDWSVPQGWNVIREKQEPIKNDTNEVVANVSEKRFDVLSLRMVTPNWNGNDKEWHCKFLSQQHISCSHLNCSLTELLICIILYMALMGAHSSQGSVFERLGQ